MTDPGNGEAGGERGPVPADDTTWAVPGHPAGRAAQDPVGQLAADDARIASIMTAWTALEPDHQAPDPGVDEAGPASGHRLARLDQAHRQLRALLDGPDA